jgi:hypothetical protein
MPRVLQTILLIAILTACIKEETVKTVTKQEVSFGVDWVDPDGLKNDAWDFDCQLDENGNLLIPTVAQIDIKNAAGNIATYTPQVFFLNGQLYTQAIKLEPGTYEVTSFFLLTHAGGTIIMATPAEGGTFAKYVSNAVAYEFQVNAFEKAQVDIEVLCFIAEKYADFGFFWFEITEIVIRQFCFFGDICANGGSEFLDETAYGGNTEGSGSPWWYYFDVNGPATQTVYAGQQPTDATVTYSNGQIIIDLGSLTLQDDDEPVRIKGLNIIPASPLPLDSYTYKGTQLIWDVDPYPFYVIHLDALVEVPAGAATPYAPSDFQGSDYENLTGGLQMDMPAIYKIHIFRTFNGETIEVPNSPFTNLGNENQPLCVKYPDRIRIAGEEFSFELHILVPDGDGGFEYQHYHTFTSTDGGPLSTDPGENNVVEFVLGNCNYSPTDLLLDW